jgi:hypothetical protein
VVEQERALLLLGHGRGVDGHSPAADTGRSDADLNARDIDIAARKIRQLEVENAGLVEELATEASRAREKDVQIDSLGGQMASLRGRIQAINGGQDLRGAQNATMVELEGRLTTALGEMQNSQIVVQMGGQMKSISEKLQQLEQVELQLRQKEDELTIATDRARTAVEAMEGMRLALQSISTLYMKFPHSAAQLERIVIELEEYKAELHRCSRDRDIPDVIRLGGVIDLRCMDAQTAKPRQSHHHHKQSAGTSATRASRGREESILRDRTAFMDDDDDDEDLSVLDPDRDAALFEDLPPPPPLMTSSSLQSPNKRGAVSVGGPQGFSSEGSSPAPGGGSAGVSEGDARLTFQLFDEQGKGVLPVDTVRLCLTTLGLPQRLLPSQCRRMTIHEFVALCSSGGH